MRLVEGNVVALQCEQCSTTLHHFEFAGDTDMATDGLGSLSSCLGNDVVISEMTAAEWNAGELGQKAFSRRASEALRRDLRTVTLSTIEPQRRFFSLTFASRKPTILQYACPCCSGGRSREVWRKTVDNFKAEGGQITILGDLSLVAEPAPQQMTERSQRRENPEFIELKTIFLEARTLLERPGNDFLWSKWSGSKEAIAEIDQIIAEITAGKILRSRLSLAALFAPTGSIQEVSMSNGWGNEFLDLAGRFDAALDRL